MSNNTTRRQFGRETLGALLTYSLLETLIGGDLLADEIKPVTAAWLAEVNELSGAVKNQKIEQVEWQRQVEALLAKVDVPELLRFVDFEKITRDVPFRERGERSIRRKFPEVDGLPTRLIFNHQIFALQEGRSVIPHGHNNMSTAFLILKGTFHGRHYDRLEDQQDHVIIKPTIDRPFEVGQYSTVSDYKDNVHWFTATSETAYIFNFHVLDVNPGSGKRTGRVYVDPDGEKLSGGRIRARRIGPGESLKLYG